ADNRLIFGGGASYLGDTSPDGHTEELRRNMRATFPVLSDIRIDYTWGGILDATMSRAPNLGTVSDNVFTYRASQVQDWSRQRSRGAR
ncbi:MAG: FAD-dependent oxidoreductase, partial [Burkholderiales bacterium]